MKITNKSGLPAPLVAAITNDPYSSGDSDISVTRLISPPRKVALERANADKIEEDAADRIWSLIGQIGHLILERANNGAVVERRLSAIVEGWKVSGQVDLVDGDLVDYKFTSLWSAKNGCKPEWIHQLNLNAWLCAQNGIEIKGLKIVAILRDWTVTEASRNPELPQRQVVVFDVPKWDSKAQFDFMVDRVKAHQMARVVLPECSDEDRWTKPPKFALMKEGRKSAVRLFDREQDAVSAMDAIVLDHQKHFIQHRKGERMRCQFYCAAAPFCEQWLAEKPEAKDDIIP